MIVTDERVARFVADGLGFNLCPPYSCIGLERDGKIISGVLFNCFEGASVHVTAYGHRWTPSIMKAIGRYVYQQLGCERMTLTTESRWVAFLACKLGGQVEGRLRSQFGKGRDGIIVGILRDEYKYGIKSITRAAGRHSAPTLSRNRPVENAQSS